jgi:CDP-glycerol glycerophosphotransferase
MLHDFGSGYGDSEKYLAEEIKKQQLPYKISWMVNDEKLEIPSFIKKVRLSRIRSIYEFSTAKVVCTTGKNRFNVKKKESQFFIYIPHGQSGAKYVEAAMANVTENYKRNSQWHSSVCNLFISSSKLQTQEMKDYFWYDGEIAEYGLPRNDIFFHYTQEDISSIKKKLGIDCHTKIALFAPTFRDNGNDQAYALDLERIIKKLELKTKEQWVFLVRLHPCFIWYKKPAFHFGSKIIDVTAYPDMQELLLASNILISDYSSTMFDFMLMKRPVFLFTKDMEDYQRMRGLKDWFSQVPFPICYDNDELIQAIKDFDAQKYQDDIERFNHLYGSLENGEATQKLLERIKSIMK